MRRSRPSSILTLPTLGALGLSLAACMTVGPDFKPPKPPGAAVGYVMAGETPSAVVRLDPEARVAGPWWSAFRSEALDRTVRLALADNLDVAQARLTLERYQASLREAEAERGPEFDLTANASRQKFNAKAFGIKESSASPFSGFGTRTFNLYSIGGRINYDLDLFGGGRRSEEEAAARVEEARRQADAAYLALSGNVALQAMRLAGLRDEIKSMEAIVSDDRILLDLAEKALGLGSIPRTTVTGVAVQLAEDEAVLPPLRREYDAARHQMALLVGKSPGEWAPPEFDLAQMAVPEHVPVSLPSELVRRRPDILAAEADVHAATAAIGVRLADQYPSLRLSPTGSFAGLSPGAVFSTDATSYNALLGLTAPIFDGGARKARTREARAEAQLALARYRQTVLKAFTEVSNAMAALKTDEAQIDAMGRAAALSGQVAEDTLAAARLGAKTAGDVVSARRQWNRDLRGLADARARRLSDLVALYAASAADWRTAEATGGADGGRPGR